MTGCAFWTKMSTIVLLGSPIFVCGIPPGVISGNNISVTPAGNKASSSLFDNGHGDGLSKATTTTTNDTKKEKTEGFAILETTNVGNTTNNNNSQSQTGLVDLQKQLSELRGTVRGNVEVHKPNKESTQNVNPLQNTEKGTSYSDLESESKNEGGAVQTIMLDKEYTPNDIAEYIFLTGDERGVAMAINDLVNDGLMLSRDDVIKFLENVKTELEYLRNRYEASISGLIQQPSTPISSNHGNPSNPVLTKENDEDDQGINGITSSSRNLEPFETKFQRLIEQAENKRSREQKSRTRSSTTDGVEGSRNSDIARRSLQKRRISSEYNYYPELGAYDTHTSRQLVTGDKKNSKTSGSLRYYFSPQSSRAQLLEIEPQEEDTEDRDDSSYNNNNIQIQNNNRPDFSELIEERMKVLSLQNIIYNLARELFRQNFKQQSSQHQKEEKEDSKGYYHYYHSDPDQTERISRFIESNVIPDRIPKQLEKDILHTAQKETEKEQRESAADITASRYSNRGSSISKNRDRRSLYNNKRDIRSTRQINLPLHIRFNGLSVVPQAHHHSGPVSYTSI